ncbi:unnamed protein product [Penicillium discolor]
MPVKMLVYLYRNPHLTPEEFKKCYEAHIKLVKKIAGGDFPLSHHRNYISRNTVAYQAFAAKIYAPDAATQITADEDKFLDRLKMGIALVGEVRVTVK